MKCEGLIIKAISGFYYVKSSENLYECKARGIFRKDGISPIVGDMVVISIPDDGYPYIEKIMPRKNYLIRPAVANIDQLIIISSTRDPYPNMLIIDKMIAIAADKNITPVLIISKSDLAEYNYLEEVYRSIGIKTIVFSCINCTNIDAVKEILYGKVSAFTGNSGVGKSTLLNCIDNNFSIKTGEISKKLGRGRHTTRQVEFYQLKGGGYVADTPGFSTVEIEKYNLIDKGSLQFCFTDFEPYLNKCKFASCTHICEKGCAIIKAVEDGLIHKSRYNSYTLLYNEVKDIKEWERR